jgi:FAD/FMN-containing dehydrogenase
MVMEIKEKLLKILGDPYVEDNPMALEAYSRDHSLLPPGMPDFIVRPANAEEVQKVVQLANEEKIPVIPVSSSIRFHGSTIPKLGGIIMDLSRMDRILNINMEDRLVTIEPGVTWGKLQSELSKIGQRCIMPLFPLYSSSVITSLLERGVPTNPRFEYSEPMCSNEVIWGNGMRFRTGSACVPGFPDKCDSRGGNPEGPGTDWYRFFQGAEGTMGIVTWSIVKFEYLPKIDRAYFISFDRLSDAIEPLYKIQRRMIGNECFLINNMTGALLFGEKWPEDFNRLKKELPPWVLVIILSGPPRFPEDKIAYEKEALDEIVAPIPQVKSISSILPCCPGLEKKLPHLLRNPWPEEKTYWKHSLKGSSQDLFFITKMERVPELTEVVREVAGSYGYNVDEIGGYLQPIEQGRASHMEYQFFYSPDDPVEKEKIKALYLEAAERLFHRGAFFSRPYGLLSRMVFDQSRGYTNTITKVKEVLDPNHILCPGNLCF